MDEQRIEAATLITSQYNDEKYQRIAENAEMRQLVADAIACLREKVSAQVPEEGGFKTVYEEFENPDTTINLTHLKLKVTPVKVKGCEQVRYLELAAYNFPNPYMAERVIKRGSKQDILDALISKELPADILRRIPKLESDLEDI